MKKVVIIDVFPEPDAAKFASIDEAVGAAIDHLVALLPEEQTKSVKLPDLSEDEQGIQIDRTEQAAGHPAASPNGQNGKNDKLSHLSKSQIEPESNEDQFTQLPLW